jgi:short-subunit dehydrogenase
MPNGSATTAVVTGAARGLGLAIAKQLHDRGHAVLMTDLDGDTVQEAARTVGPNAWGRAQDVRVADGHNEIAAEAASRGKLSVWVNNAGILIAGDSWAQEASRVQALLDINVAGMMYGSAAAVKAMSGSGGAILNVASLSAFGPVPGLAAYAASKAAVKSFTTSLQGELNGAGIKIKACALCPDVVNTAMVTEQAQEPGAALLFSGPKPLTTEEVAARAMDLIESRQLVRVVPRYRGVLIRGADIAPALGLKLLAGFKTVGLRRQRASR